MSTINILKTVFFISLLGLGWTVNTSFKIRNKIQDQQKEMFELLREIRELKANDTETKFGPYELLLNILDNPSLANDLFTDLNNESSSIDPEDFGLLDITKTRKALGGVKLFISDNQPFFNPSQMGNYLSSITYAISKDWKYSIREIIQRDDLKMSDNYDYPINFNEDDVLSIALAVEGEEYQLVLYNPQKENTLVVNGSTKTFRNPVLIDKLLKNVLSEFFGVYVLDNPNISVTRASIPEKETKYLE